MKLMTFEKLKIILTEDDSELTTSRLFLAGACAGALAHGVCFPLEVLKIRLSVSSTATNISMLLSKIIKNEGRFYPFYRGLSLSLASTIPRSGFNLMTYELCKRFFLNNSEPDMFRLLIAGSLSSSLSHTIFYPLHTVKARLITNNHADIGLTRSFNGVFDVIQKTLQKEGFLGFYKGFLPSFLKSVLSHGILYTTFDILKRIFEES